MNTCVAAGLGKTEEALRLAKQPLSEKYGEFLRSHPGVLGRPMRPVGDSQGAGGHRPIRALGPCSGNRRFGQDPDARGRRGRPGGDLRWLVSQGVPLEAKADGGLNFDATPLTAAAATGNTRAAKALLDAGASLEATNRKKRAPVGSPMPATLRCWRRWPKTTRRSSGVSSSTAARTSKAGLRRRHAALRGGSTRQQGDLRAALGPRGETGRQVADEYAVARGGS